MTISETPTRRQMPNKTRKLWVGALVLLAVALITGAASLAFLFESPSMNYKFGWDKVMLRTGKILGLTAAVLLFLQLPIAGRIKFLDRIFSLPGLYQVHRYNAYIIGLLILIHPVLISLPEGRILIPFEARYWPEWVGFGLLLAVLAQIILGKWRAVLMKHYPRWLFLHRCLGLTVLALLVIHVLYVSETFEHKGLPRNAVIIFALVIVIMWIAIRGQRLWARRHPLEVSRIDPAGKDAYAIELSQVRQHDFPYIPGQFAFLSFASPRLSAEWHPFTLSSSPTRPNGLQVIVRCCGDWTNHIDTIQKGDRVYVHGPFGRFSHLLEDLDKELIMIAGGIGITPMLSMLRELYDKGDQRHITLLWSNQTAQHLFNQDEFKALEQKLPNFNWIPIFTARREPMGEFGRLNLSSLKNLLAKHPRDAVIFLCGPPIMIKQVHKDLIALGFSEQSIKEELFGL